MADDGNAPEGTPAQIAAELEQLKQTVVAAQKAAIAEIEQARVAVTTAKATVDAALAEIEKAKTGIATAKGGIDAAQATVNADLANIGTTKNEVEKLKAAIVAEKESLDGERTIVSEKITELEKKIEPLEEMLSQLTEIKDEAETERKSVASAIAEITKANQDFQTLNTQAQQKHNELKAQFDAAKTNIDEVNEAHENVRDFEAILFKDEDGKPSIKTGISELQTKTAEVFREAVEQRDSAKQAFSDFQSAAQAQKEKMVVEVQEEFGQLHTLLEAEIRALLPSAGAAGLSSTYYDAKSRYAWTSFKGKPGSKVPDARSFWERFVLRFRSFFGYNPTSLFSTIFFYILFIVPILIIVWIFWDLLRNLPYDKVKTFDIAIVALRILIAIPLAAISAFGFVSLNLYRRLFEEFNYKQRVMELYSSFSKEISQAGTDEQKKALLTVMIGTVADRSYLAKDAIEGKGEQEILDKLDSISSIVANFAKIKSG